MCLLAAPREGGDAVDFVAVVDQAIALLRQRGRLTYGTLKRQFQLDDAALDDLKDELIVGQRLAVDEDGRVLVWTGGSSSAPTTASVYHVGRRSCSGRGHPRRPSRARSRTPPTHGDVL